jgi:hypothetical protein
MQAKRRTYQTPAASTVAADDSPNRYWGLAVVAACAASWAAIFAAAKLVLAFI